MIRVLHVITHLPIGGAERMLIGALRRMDRTRVEPIVCCIMDRGELASELDAAGLRVFSMGLMQKHGFDRKVVPALAALIKELGIDVVHTHLYHANMYGRLAASRCGIPSIASVHNTYPRRKWYRHLINWYLSRSTFRVTAGSPEVVKDIKRYDHVPSHKIVLLTNAIDFDRVETSLSKREAKQQLLIDPSSTLIATVGRMEEQKGHKFLLMAFAELLKRRPKVNLTLMIVGDGRLKEPLLALASELGVTERCRFPGAISQLAPVYRAIDLFVMPSLWEGLSLAMLEAMAASLPVIATEVGGAASVIGNNEYGCLIKPGSVADLTRSLEVLVDDKNLQNRLGQAAHEHVLKRYSVEALAKEWSDLYDEARRSWI